MLGKLADWVHGRKRETMMRLIDADALLQTVCLDTCGLSTPDNGLECKLCGIAEMIKSAPTYTCENCIYGYNIDHELIFCFKPATGFNNPHEKNWFCADWCKKE